MKLNALYRPSLNNVSVTTTDAKIRSVSLAEENMNPVAPSNRPKLISDKLKSERFGCLCWACALSYCHTGVFLFSYMTSWCFYVLSFIVLVSSVTLWYCCEVLPSYQPCAPCVTSSVLGATFMYFLIYFGNPCPVPVQSVLLPPGLVWLVSAVLPALSSIVCVSL